jgi:hypothetical protein
MDDRYTEKLGDSRSSISDNRVRSLKNLEKKQEIRMPSGFQMAKNFTKSMVKTAKSAAQGKEIVAKSELYSKRTSVCRSCPWFSEKGERCQKCGCVIPLKAYFAQEKCPVGKW